MDLSTLPVINTLSDCITIRQKDQIKIAYIQHPKATAAISLFGAHMLSYIPQGQQDLLWMSEASAFDGKTAIRGGIPVCWPWFANFASPSHGYARTSEWRIVEHQENDKGVIIQLGLKTNDAIFSVWPNQFELLLSIEVAETLKVSMNITNIDSKPWAFSGALHSYLNVGDISKTSITGMGPSYIDKLLDGKQVQGEDTLLVDRGIDRIYTEPESTILIKDEQRHRTLHVENSGHNCAVLWNPWQEGSQSMKDMQNDGYRTMICAESVLYASDEKELCTLQPGERYTLSTSLSSEV
ncbi:D-hexose-6-phosphate mutarotase [Vibrio sp. S4M6]|uniref:D-hexose-6-phosphate mutarotase n=1 Tax=Vibrio sinus TaxID=2946865 RepID=UPI002029EA43|nr:D-hexose-6-phosphate mutarotase [Vibrio sinus]MCL9783081.1 D-hexose-6-phosphate mutarotase [Vibrio sinus]